MRYEDASGAFQASGPVANDDADTLAAGSRGPATGNLITGEGTQYGAAGADSAAGAHVAAIAGQGGEDSSFAGGKLSVSGQYGSLSVDAEGNYSYMANKGAPENVRDRFTYTLADNQGNTDTGALIVELGKTPAVIKADAQQVVVGPDGVVTLPPGVELSDIMVVGRNLVVNMPDGTQLIIVDGAVFVPQLSLGGVEVPATNVAALLVGQEVQPAAGEVAPSSGGNFALPPPPLDPGVPLGDLLPPTEYDYIPPEPQEVFDILDDEPEIFVQPDGQPASIAAVDQVEEAGLPSRNGNLPNEPAGSGESADGNGADNDVTSETTGGNIVYDSPDGVDSITLNGVAITAVGQVINGAFGTLTITSIAPGVIGYGYTLRDNTAGNDTHDDFAVVLTDNDGDTATATLRIDIIDDVPTARPDTDVIPSGQFGPATGNVITDASAGDAGDSDSGADTVGADNASITAVSSVNVPANSDNNPAGGFVVNGQYGVLTLNTDGSYSYVRNPGTPGGVNDVFNYTLTDGDGDTSTTTLTISIADTPPTIDVPVAGEDGTQVNERGLPTRGGEPAGSGEIADGNGEDNDDTSETTSGVVNFTPGDTPATIRIDGVAVTAVGQTFTGDHGVLTITAIGANSVSYSYTLTDNTSGDATSDSFAFSVTDADGDVASGNLVIAIVDDVPSAANDTDLVPGGSFAPATGNVITDAAPGDAGDSDNGADTVGADNASITRLASNNVPANVDADAAGGFVVNGQYGVLTMQADGSYSYVRNPGSPGGVDDVFTYSLTDGDGDVDTATLTISIGDSPVSIDAPDQGEAGTVVDEQGLPTRNGGEPAGTGEAADGNGSDNDDTSETTAGIINFSAPDTPATITIDGVAVTAVGQTFNGAHGVLTITSIAAGSIGYSYTLTDNTSGDATSDDFALQVTDADGDVASDTLVINIIDDQPIAVNDTDSIAAGQYGPATGNVITDAAPGDAGDGDSGADNVGADNAQVSAIQSVNVPANSDNTASGGDFVVNGQYGTLTINQDGSYSYVRGAGTPGGVNDVFTYTLTDGDGDSTTAALTISIADSPTTIDAPDQGEAGTIVDEQGLPTRNGGEPAGTGEAADGNSSDNDDPSETTGATIIYTAPDGPATVTIDGTAVTFVGQTFAGSFGTLTITSIANGSIGYSYTLNDNTSGNSTFDDFALQVIDQDGDVANDTLRIDIVDDTPLATNDVDVIIGGNGPATGNVITGVDSGGGDANASDGNPDNVGADNALVSLIQSNNVPANSDNTPTAGNFVVSGQYGVLTINQNGTYSYLRNDGTPGGVQDVFTYTLTDGDGDIITATLTISIDDNFPNPPANEVVLLDDDTEAGGNAGGPGDRTPNTDNTSGTLEALGGDGDLDYFFSITQNLPTGFTSNVVTLAGVSTMTISQGGTPVIEITLNNESGVFNVTQLAAIDHAADGNTEGEVPLGNILSAIDVSVFAQDADGDQSPPGTISISVDDDTPTIDVQATGETAVFLTTQDAETDGVPTDQDTAVSAINFNNVFSLASSAGADGGSAQPLSFALAVTNVVSGLESHDVPINLFLIGGKVVGSTAADAGSVNAGNTIFDIAVSGMGVVTLTQYQQVDHAVEGVTTAPFDDQFAILADGKVTLTASSSITDGDGDTLSDQAVVDLGGNIRFADDGPVATNDVVNQGTENQPVTFGVFGNDQFGADGVDTLNPPPVNVSFTQPAQGGTVTYNANTGQFTFTPAPGQQGVATFNYTITDFDGDTSTATVTINLQPDSTPVAADSTAAVDDDGLAGGNAASVTGDLNANASPPEAPTVNPSEAIFHGQLSATSGGDTIASFTFASMHGTSGTVGQETVNYTWNAGTSTLTATGPRGVLFDVVINQATGEYNLTLRDNVLHTAGSNENDATTNLTFTVTDSDGDPDTGIIVVTFDDDAPTIGTIENGTASNNPADPTSSGELNFVVGADSPGSVVNITATNTGITSGGFNLVTNFSGNVLTAYQDLNGNGTYDAATDMTAVYTLTANSAAGADGEWVFNLITPFDPTVTETAIGGSSSFGAGPTAQGQALLNVAGTETLAVVSGYHMTGSFNEATWLATGNAGPAGNFDTAGVNGSTAGWGIDNNNFNGTDEMFVWDFGSQALRDPDGAGPPATNYTPPVGVTLPDISTATFDLIGYSTGAGDDISYVVHYTDGTFDSGHVPAVDINDGTWKFIADAGKFIADIEMFASGLGSGKVDLVSVGVQDSDLTENIGFNVTLQDADGDQVSGGFTVNVADGNTPSVAMAPLATKQAALDKTAANSNSLTMATAVAASGMADSAAAQPAPDPAVMRSADVTQVSDSGGRAHQLSTHDGDAGNSLTAAQPEASQAEAPASSSGNSRSDANAHDGKLDASANSSSSDEGSSHQAANDQGPAVNAEPQVAVAPTVMMASAEQLQAAGLSGEAKQGGAAEKIVAEALGGGDAPTVDGLLAHLPGGIQALAHVASQDAGSVPGWDMAAHGAFGAGNDMLIKVDVISNHHDALQPAVNG